MGRCRFVQPETTVINLSDGDWIEVKKRLTLGEERAAFQKIVGEVNSEGWRRPNVEMLGIAEMAAYILNWSFRDAEGRPVAVSMAAIQQLDRATGAELQKAIETHIAAMDAEETERKNNSDGENAPVPISPSAS